MSESYWEAVVASDVRVPVDADLHELTAELVTWLGDPRARRREEIALPVLATWIARGVYDSLLVGLGDGVATGLLQGLGNDRDDSVLRRSTSALVLTEILARDNAELLLSGADVLRWGDLATSWYVRETDLRGYLPGRGWACCVSHGADLLGQLLRSRHLTAMEQTAVLDVVADRLLTPTDHVFRHGEDDRLAHCVMAALHRGDVSLGVVEGWVRRLGAGIRHPVRRGDSEVTAEWPTPEAVNTSAFLRALHLQLALGVRGRSDARADDRLFADPPRDRADLILVVLEQLRASSPWLFGSRAMPVVTV